MPKEFPRGKPGDQPTQGDADELLEKIPEGGEEGSIDGYVKGTKVRRWVFGVLVVGTIGAGIAGHRYVKYLQEERKKIKPEYVVDDDAAARAVREFYWDDGPARLGLSREPPGIERIVLPDREIVLAEGYDHAQVNVDVRNGKTIKLKVLTGKIKQTPTGPPAEAKAP